LPGFVYPSDLEPSTRWYGRSADVIKLSMTADGRMEIPSASIAQLLNREAFQAASRLLVSSPD
jgi:hypothetical protein